VPFKNAVPIEGASANAFAVLFDDTFFFSSCHESLTLYACTKECSLEGVAGLLHFAGSVSALAYLGPKESISEAISDLKVVMEYQFPLFCLFYRVTLFSMMVLYCIHITQFQFVTNVSQAVF
jgi:hypothetical protein